MRRESIGPPNIENPPGLIESSLTGIARELIESPAMESAAESTGSSHPTTRSPLPTTSPPGPVGAHRLRLSWPPLLRKNRGDRSSVASPRKCRRRALGDAAPQNGSRLCHARLTKYPLALQPAVTRSSMQLETGKAGVASGLGERERPRIDRRSGRIPALPYPPVDQPRVRGSFGRSSPRCAAGIFRIDRRRGAQSCPRTMRVRSGSRCPMDLHSRQ